MTHLSGIGTCDHLTGGNRWLATAIAVGYVTRQAEVRVEFRGAWFSRSANIDQKAFDGANTVLQHEHGDTRIVDPALHGWPVTLKKLPVTQPHFCVEGPGSDQYFPISPLITVPGPDIGPHTHHPFISRSARLITLGQENFQAWAF